MSDSWLCVADLSENSVLSTKPDDPKTSVKKQHKELKTKRTEVQDSQRHLEALAANVDTQLRDVSQFDDPKVIELWLLAKKANFTQLELDSFEVCGRKNVRSGPVSS